ncbi:hypothetical protein KZI27_00275 (plasmid) [Curtobacterium sp. TC1]|uniref:BsuBI/PstI family type II restriction endonuclease n=1 Tax=Curtobacterium sp. TC1 TaxID=2862880 RepID=UPI001C9B18E3|nr:BsuBI/PstI family type II restriction endonuclease [Curtobacterium sp. TC1]QZQ53711.1 hypothetical protein KZI27_00275 [Curtobacterium sp. TC1]
MPTLRPIISRELAAERLLKIFPREAFDTNLSSPISAAGVAALIYVGAVGPGTDTVWARPSTALWMQEDVLLHAAADERRLAWGKAAMRGREKVAELLGSWGITFQQWYAQDSRESLRDDSWNLLRANNAMVTRPGVKTNSSAARWALADHFADLFDPALEDDQLDTAITTWIETHMTTSARAKAMAVRDHARAADAVKVTLPDGSVRLLEPGHASLILKGVVEEWAPRKLHTPMVLAISEPGDKQAYVDEQRLQTLGVSISVSKLLPDALLFDAGPDGTFWVVEAVYTDGPIDAERKAQLLQWAAAQQIPPTEVAFLTAFESRNASPAKRRLKDLAPGTFAWFRDEPEFELGWDAISGAGSQLAPVTLLKPKAP